jgi:hypothetical protein
VRIRLKRPQVHGILIVGIVLCTVVGIHAAGATPSVSGVVRSHDGPVAGAMVRVQTTGIVTVTDERGEFVVTHLPGAKRVRLTASAPGYYIAGIDVGPEQRRVTIQLRALPRQDNAEYQWVSPFSSSGVKSSCQNCHSQPGKSSRLLFDEWIADAHGRSARNPRFLSMYKGTDLSGHNQSPPTRFAVQQDYGRVALRPDPKLPYFGPGFQLDAPGTAGNCAACHAPAAAVRSPYGTRPDQLSSPASDGITCDFCHKVADVRINRADRRPYTNTPGVLSFIFLRPASSEQVFLGPLDDVAPGDDAYSELHKQSTFCAPCHFGQFWGVQVYDSFGEWLDSPYSHGPRAQTCQDCHMPRRGATHFVRINKGGRLRNPDTIYSHRMRGPDDAAFMQEAARLDVVGRRDGSLITVSAKVTNSGAGHSLPTDHPARNILLVIRATDSRGEILELVEGPVIPAWAGEGGDAADYAGRPGRGFARILEERWTGVAPTVAYWNPTIVRTDTRILPLQSDSSEYRFHIQNSGAVHITARLIYRRAFRALAKTKGWTDTDILMQQKRITITR